MGGGRTVPAADTLWFDANRTIMTEISRRKPPDLGRLASYLAQSPLGFVLITFYA